MILLLNQIFITHEISFQQIKLYPNESYVISNDIYFEKPLETIENFSGSLDGRTNILDNLLFDDESFQFFDNFQGSLFNIALKFVPFDITNQNIYGISEILQGTLADISISTSLLLSGTEIATFYVLGDNVGASVSGVWADLNIQIKEEATLAVTASFANTFTASLTNSLFKSQFVAIEPFMAFFNALCQKDIASTQSNVTVITKFDNIFTDLPQMSLITNEISSSSISDLKVYIDLTFVDTNSSQLFKLFIICGNIQANSLIDQLLITASLKIDSYMLNETGFLVSQPNIQMKQSYIKFELNSNFPNHTVFGFFLGDLVSITLKNSSFIGNISVFVNGNYSTISQSLQYATISQLSIQLYFDMTKTNLNTIYFSGLAQSTQSIDLSYSTIYIQETQNTQVRLNKLAPIIMNAQGGTISFISSYFFLIQVPTSTFQQSQSGFISSLMDITVENCLVFLNYTLAVGTNSNYSMLLETANQAKITNITFQTIVSQEYSNQQWALLGYAPTSTTYENINILAEINFSNHQYLSPITVFAYEITECTVKNVFMNVNLQCPSLGQIAVYQFMVCNDAGGNIIQNVIYAGLYVNSVTLKAYQPNGVSSGINETDGNSIIYTDEQNKFPYDSETQKTVSAEELKDSAFMETISQFDPSVWKFVAGVNFGFPKLNYVSFTEYWALETYEPFNNEFLQQITGAVTTNHFIAKDGPNLCQMGCTGKKYFWDQSSTCDSGFTGENCEVDCATNPCQNGGVCNSGVCECVGGFSGLVCEIPHCDGCDTVCELVLGDTFQCGRSCVKGTTCILGTCVDDICICDVNVTSGIDEIAKCNKTDSCIFSGCGALGVCVNETCGCDLEAAVQINGTCYERTHKELGECGVVGDGYECVSCIQERKLPLCDVCLDDLKDFEDVCYPICELCNGDCITISEDEIHCFSCKNDYEVPKCETCIPDYREFEGTCYEITNVDKGDCWLVGTDTTCETCLYNYSLPDCMKCLPDYIEDSNICYPACPEDICYGVNCFEPVKNLYLCDSCNEGYVVPDCTKCEETYKNVTGICYLIVQPDNGDCWNQVGVVTCSSCINNFKLPDCQTCIDNFLFINESCLEICTDCNGIDCVILSNLTEICESCSEGYELPACKECVPEYLLVDNICYEIINKDKGICWNKTNITTCSSCHNNYSMPDCESCLPNYIEGTLDCLLACKPDICYGTDCMISSASGDTTCNSCKLGFVMPDCMNCELGFVLINGTCLVAFNEERGDCFKDSGDNIICVSCKNGFLMPTCDTCETGFEEVNYVCLEICELCQGKQCYIYQNSSQICESCNSNFKLPDCINCEAGFILHKDICVELIPNSNGNCIIDAGITLCLSCDEGYVISLNQSNCLIKCNSTTCKFGNCLIDEACNCNSNIQGVQCDECIPNFGFVDDICYEIVPDVNGSCFLHRNSSIFCTECDAGYELSEDKTSCILWCSSENCINGDCIKGSGCVCHPGYEITDNCLVYNCTLDPLNACNLLGSCKNHACECYPNMTLIQSNCISCMPIVNGICDDFGIVCHPGWSGKNCDIFNCKGTDACVTQYFENKCVAPHCNCAYLNQQTMGACIDFCNSSQLSKYLNIDLLSMIQIDTFAETVNLGTILSIIPNNFSLANRCILGCLGCVYNSGSFKCNPGVHFKSMIIAGSEMVICQGCKQNYQGDDCINCDKFSMRVNGECQLKCLNCNGECFYNQFENIECLLCDENYTGDDCSLCEENYVLVEGVCYQKCQSCKGECYITPAGIVCRECDEGYDIANGCQGCDSGYVEFQKLCLEKCESCTQGECFYYEGEIICSSCSNSAELVQCKNCLDGFVLYKDMCTPLIPGKDCIYDDMELICFSCDNNQYLINNTCYEKCSLPFCDNGICYNSPVPICELCSPEYIMQANGSCLEMSVQEGGKCTIEQNPICYCYEGYTGSRCDECSINAIQLELSCFMDCSLMSNLTCNGVCNVSFAFEDTLIICSSCNTGYKLPSCSECDYGYKLSVDLSCKLCEDGWIDNTKLPSNIQGILGEGCFQFCDYCEQGDCWYKGSTLICTSCSPGYNFLSNCKNCEEGYIAIGQRCLEDSLLPQGSCGSYSEVACINCVNNYSPVNCQTCLTGYVEVAERCYQPISYFEDNCITLEQNKYTCDDNAICKQGYYYLNLEYCTECNAEYILLNYSCWIQLEKAEMSFSGECYENALNGSIYCEQCDEYFQGEKCDQCANECIQCYTFQCCQIAKETQNLGICYKNSTDQYICNTCVSGLELVDQFCVGKQPKNLQHLWWLLLLILLALIFYFIFGKQHKLKVLRHKVKLNSLRIIRAFLKIFCGVLFCQIIALCVAMQDAYVDDIYLYSASLSIGSFPFAFFLFLLQPPNLDRFFYHKISDFFFFLVGAGLDFLFQLVVYLLLPEALSVSQTIFKCFSAPFSMLLFTFILKMKYKFNQMLLLFIAVALPIYYAMATSFADVFSDPFSLEGENYFSLIMGIFETLFATLVQACQILFLQNILGSYSEVQVMTRLGFAFFLLYFVYSLLNLREVIDSVTSQKESFFIAVGLVIVMNVLMPITLMFISPLAVTFNMLTSAVWMEIIDALSNGIGQNDNFYPMSLYPMVFCSIMFCVVFVSLVVYYKVMNYSYEKFNQEINSKKEKKEFLKPYFAMKRLQVKEYKDMTGVKKINPNILKTFIQKETIQSKQQFENPSDFVCIDNETGEEIQFLQPKIQNEQKFKPSHLSLANYKNPFPQNQNHMVELSNLSESSIIVTSDK